MRLSWTQRLPFARTQRLIHSSKSPRCHPPSHSVALRTSDTLHSAISCTLEEVPTPAMTIVIRPTNRKQLAAIMVPESWDSCLLPLALHMLLPGYFTSVTGEVDCCTMHEWCASNCTSLKACIGSASSICLINQGRCGKEHWMQLRESQINHLLWPAFISIDRDAKPLHMHIPYTVPAPCLSPRGWSSGLPLLATHCTCPC